ncbi:MAG: tetratricopeptide repeat protein [Magnetococcales bacterium]|nr:tetratricopeptide repeat protein [Magnetococcales bacterium]
MDESPMAMTGISRWLLFLALVLSPLAVEAGPAQELKAGAAALKRHQTNEAVTIFTRLINKRGATPAQKAAAYGGRCLARQKIGLTKNDRKVLRKAVIDCTQAIELKASHYQPHRTRGNARLALGEMKSAIRDFTSAVQVDPNDYLSYQGRGMAYARQGEEAKARKDYDTAIRLKPENPWSYFNRGKLHSEYRRYQKAVDDFSEFIRFKPDYEPVFLERGKARMLRGHYQQAIADFYESLRLKPVNNAMAYGFRGMALFLLSRYQEAEEDFRTVLASHPGDLEIRLWLFMSMERRGKSGKSAFTKTALDNPSQGWPDVLISHLMGRVGTDQVVKTAKRTLDIRQRRLREVQASFFLGQKAIIDGSQPQAEKWFNRGVATKKTDAIYFFASKQGLKFLGSGEPKPSLKKPPTQSDAELAQARQSRKSASKPAPAATKETTAATGESRVSSHKSVSSTKSTKAATRQPTAAAKKSKSAAKSATLKAGFAFKVASFREADNAQNAIQQVTRLGFPGFIEKVKVRGHLYQRVWVGPFKREQDAWKARERIRRLPGRYPGRVLYRQAP